jgi:hypothetical protein
MRAGGSAFQKPQQLGNGSYQEDKNHTELNQKPQSYRIAEPAKPTHTPSGLRPPLSFVAIVPHKENLLCCNHSEIAVTVAPTEDGARQFFSRIAL